MLLDSGDDVGLSLSLGGLGGVDVLLLFTEGLLVGEGLGVDVEFEVVVLDVVVGVSDGVLLD